MIRGSSTHAWFYKIWAPCGHKTMGPLVSDNRKLADSGLFGLFGAVNYLACWVRPSWFGCSIIFEYWEFRGWVLGSLSFFLFDPIVFTGWQSELSCWGVCFYNVQKNACLPNKHCIVIRLSIWFTSTCSVIHLREVYKVSPAMTTSSFRFDSISSR